MSIQAICPMCQQGQKVPDTQAGKRIRCKECNHTFAVKVEDETEAMVVEAVEDDPPARKPARKPQQDVTLDHVELADDDDVRTTNARPAKSRRAAAADDDEDGGKKRRPARDEDEGGDEDEKPKKKKGGAGTILLVLGGIAALLVLLCGGGVIGGGYWAYSRSRAVVVAGADKQMENDLKKWADEMEKANKDKGFDPNKDKNPFDPNKDKTKVEQIPEPKDVTQALAQMNDGRPEHKRKAILFLLGAEIEEGRRDEVARALVTAQNVPAVRDDAKRAHDRWAPKVEKIPDPPDVATALTMLQDQKFERQQVAVRYLKSATVDNSKREEVTRALEPLKKNAQFGNDLTEAMRRWAPPLTVADLERKLASTDQLTWHRAMEDLHNMKTEEAAQVLAKQLPVDNRGFLAAQYLAKMGKVAEKEVLPYYNDAKGAANAREALNKLRPANDVLVKQCLSDLEKTGKPGDQGQEVARKQKRANAIDALTKLKKTNDDDVNSGINAQLAASLSDQNLADPAFNALQTWATKDNVPALIALGNKDQTKAERIVTLLTTKFPDHEMVTPLLVGQLADRGKRNDAHKKLAALGEKAELAVLKVMPQILNHKVDHLTRRAFYDVLRDVGTTRSLVLLGNAAKIESLKGGDRTNIQHIVAAQAAAKGRGAPKN